MQEHLINLRSKRHYPSILTCHKPVYKSILWPDKYHGLEAITKKNNELNLSLPPSLNLTCFQSYTAPSFKNFSQNFQHTQLINFDKPSKRGRYRKTCWCDECGSSINKDPYLYKPYLYKPYLYKPYFNRFSRERNGIHPCDLFRVHFVLAFPGISPLPLDERPGSDLKIWPSIKCVLCFACLNDILNLWQPCLDPVCMRNWHKYCETSRDLSLVILDQTLSYSIEW